MKGFLLVYNKTFTLAKSHPGVDHQPVSSRVRNCKYGELRFTVMPDQSMIDKAVRRVYMGRQSKGLANPFGFTPHIPGYIKEDGKLSWAVGVVELYLHYK